MSACQRLRGIALLGLLWVAGCGDTRGIPISFAMSGAGETPAPFTVDDWEVTLEDARVAFGPVTFCTTEAATPELCEAAVAEARTTTVIDGLDPSPQPLADVEGFSETVRSAFFDYGIVWLLTQPAPQVLAGAPDGHSAVIRGTARRDDITIAFTANVDVVPRTAGDANVRSFRTRHTLGDPDDALLVRIAPRSWVGRIDFDALAAALPDGGEVELVPGSQGYEALIGAMTSSRLPVFEWSP